MIKESATVKALKSTELIEIDKTGLDLILDSASNEVKTVILKLCEELSKELNSKIPFSLERLNDIINNENELVVKFARQIYYRLDKSTHVE